MKKSKLREFRKNTDTRLIISVTDKKEGATFIGDVKPLFTMFGKKKVIQVVEVKR